jgi:hypothetical protein
VTAVTFLAVLAIASLNPDSCHSDTISFDSSVWDHNDGNGPSVAWTDGQFQGVTPIGDEQLILTSSSIGAAAYTADHFSRIDATFFSGFAFQLDPDTTVNTTTFDNYARYDFEFSFPVQLDSFTLTDVDRADGQWYDAIAAEGFDTQVPGAVGSGFAANYSFEPGTNMETFTQFGLLGARPTATSGNVQNTPENDATFNFTESIQSFSIYHWNLTADDSAAGSQTIGIRGNEFEISVFGTAWQQQRCLQQADAENAIERPPHLIGFAFLVWVVSVV